MQEDTKGKDLTSGKGASDPVSAQIEEERTRNQLGHDSDTPLFLRYGSDGRKGDAQDEKDKSAE